MVKSRLVVGGIVGAAVIVLLFALVILPFQEIGTPNLTTSDGITVVEDGLIHTEENLRVAFIGDTHWINPNAIKVLNLIKDEEAQMVLHSGDIDYRDLPTHPHQPGADPDGWDKHISDILGDDFPYFVTIGGHDVVNWDDYQSKLYERMKKNPDVECVGNLGVKSICTYKGLLFIQVSPGMAQGIKNFNPESLSLKEAQEEPDFSLFIEDQLNNNDYVWNICSWHKTMNKMQTGTKPDKAGWEVYETCKNNGSIIAAGSEHSYHRTKTLIDIENQIVDPKWSEPNELRVKEGSTFVLVSGIGGHSIRDQDRCLPFSYPYGCNGEWATIYTSDQNANFGALFCTFNVGGQPNKAYCYFKNIDGRIIDAFTVTSFLGTDYDDADILDMSGRNLTGDDLSNRVITDANLSNTIFVDANLSNSVLIGTTLTGADFTNANLTDVILNGNDLTGTILRGADLTGVNLSGIDLSNKDLTGTILRGADLTNANLGGIDLSGRDLTGTILRGADLSKANLDYVDFYGLDLTDANLSGQDLSDKDLTGTILRGTNLSDANLKSFDLSGRDLTGTNLTGVDLTAVDLSDKILLETILTNSILKNANLSGAIFLEVDLANANLTGANLDLTSFAYSNLSGINLNGATLDQNNFKHTNISGVDFTVVNNKLIRGTVFDGAYTTTNVDFEGIDFFDGVEYSDTYPGQAYRVDEIKLGGENQFVVETGFLNKVVVSKKVVGNDLVQTFVYNTSFGRANLQNANFSNANLMFSILYETDLTNANLSNVDLTGANLTGATLDGAVLDGAILDAANLDCKNHPACNN